jgi:hypothetical protein
MPQLIVLGSCEMSLQKFGDGHVVLQCLQGLVKQGLMSISRLLARDFSAVESPWRTLDRQLRKPCLAQQGPRDRSLAMDEFGATLRGVSELGNRKWMDAPAAPISRFQYCHPLARTSKLAGSHQACRTCANDNGMSWTRSHHMRLFYCMSVWVTGLFRSRLLSKRRPLFFRTANCFR